MVVLSPAEIQRRANLFQGITPPVTTPDATHADVTDPWNFTQPNITTAGNYDVSNVTKQNTQTSFQELGKTALIIAIAVIGSIFMLKVLKHSKVL